MSTRVSHLADINILQWNPRSITNKKAELQNLITIEKPNVICLYETHLNDLSNLQCINFSNFNNIIQNRETRGGGGVAILVDKNIKMSPIFFPSANLHSSIEVVGCNLNIPNLEMTITSVYIPPGPNLNQNAFNQLFREIKAKSKGLNIICGDFNAHNTIWGDQFADARGNSLLSAAEDENLVIINDGSPTRFGRSRNSCLDITLVAPGIAIRSIWNTISDTLGSDHCPITTKCN